MEAGKRTINDLFTGSKLFEIPFFQRAYVWDEPQWSRLLEDIEELCDKDQPKPYFLGSVILKQQPTSSGSKVGDIRTIIDGQQRLTSLSILLKVLCLKTNELRKFNRRFRLDDDSIVILHNHNDVKAFNKVMELDKLDTLSGDDKITRAYNYFAKALDPQKVFFDTKTYWDQEVTTGRVRRTFIDLFFYAFLQIKMQDANLKVKTEHKNAFSNVAKLFDSYKEFISIYLPGQKLALLREIKEYASVFRKAIHRDVLDEELSASAGMERLNVIIFNLDTATLIPYLLYVEKNVDDENEKSLIYGYLESYIMRRLVCRESTKNYNQLFGERLILNGILTKNELTTWIASQDDKVNRMPTDTEVSAAFHSAHLTNKYAIGVLYLIESKIRNRSFHSTQLLGISKYSLEHMMPKKWRNNWKFTGTDIEADLRDNILLTLGNLTIITQSLNASIRDANWATKQDGQGDKGGLRKYADGIETLSQYLYLDEWNEQTIESRASDLAQLALTCWKS